MDKLLSAAKAAELSELDQIYLCIPEDIRGKYGATKEEQCANFIKENPDVLANPEPEVIDLSTDDKVLDYIVQYVTNALGSANIAYKGGYILNKLIPNVRRTYDVDFSIAKHEQYLDVKNVLTEIGDYLKSSNIVDDYELKKDATECSSGGIKFIRGGTHGLGVDVGIHPLGFGITRMKLEFGEVNRFTVERSLTDKVSVICSPKRFRRSKDLYDTYMLITCYDIDGDIFSTCKEHRDIDYTKMPLSEEIITQWNIAYSKLALGDTKRNENKPEFVRVYNIVMAFVRGTQDCKNKRWECANLVWKEK